MRKLLATVFVLSLAFSALADRITATITVTNAATNGQTLVVWTNTYYWVTNITNSSINVATTNSALAAKTNLYSFVVAHPITAAWASKNVSTNSFQIVGPNGTNWSASASAGWATVAMSTDYVASATSLMIPPNWTTNTSIQTNSGSRVVDYLAYSTNPASVAWKTFTNFVDRNTAQTITAQKTFYAPRFSGPFAFASDDPNVISRIMTTDDNGTGQTDVRVEMLDDAGATNRVMWFYGDTAGVGGIWVLTNFYLLPQTCNAGAVWMAQGTNGRGAWSQLAYVQVTNGTATGFEADGVTLSETFLGTDRVKIYSENSSEYGNCILSNISSGSIWKFYDTAGMYGGGPDQAARLKELTNCIYALSTALTNSWLLTPNITNGTTLGSLTMRSKAVLAPFANAGLVNGYNSGVLLGSNAYARLSGGTACVTNAGFVAGSDGEVHIVQVSGGTTFVLLNESGLEATAANRILTGTGAPLEITNSPCFVTLIYDGAVSRWRPVLTLDTSGPSLMTNTATAIASSLIAASNVAYVRATNGSARGLSLADGILTWPSWYAAEDADNAWSLSLDVGTTNILCSAAGGLYFPTTAGTNGWVLTLADSTSGLVAWKPDSAIDPTRWVSATNGTSYGLTSYGTLTLTNNCDPGKTLVYIDYPAASSKHSTILTNTATGEWFTDNPDYPANHWATVQEITNAAVVTLTNLATAASQIIDLSKTSQVTITNSVAGNVTVLLTNCTAGQYAIGKLTADGTARTISFFAGPTMTWISTNGTSAATNLYVPASKTGVFSVRVWPGAGTTNLTIFGLVQP